MPADNSIRRAAETDEVFVGASVGVCTPKTVEVFAHVGLDFAFLDLEHRAFSAWNGTALEHYTRVPDIDLLARIPSGAATAHPPLVRKVLDTGVRNVLVPRVETAAEVRAAVEASRFRYDGEVGDRGLGAGRSSRYGADLDADYPGREDAEVSVGIMIENRAAVENVDEILAVPGLGFVFVGLMDLSHSLGHPTEIDHPEVRAALETVESACASSDVALGSMFFDPASVEETVGKGYQLLVAGSEIGAARQAFGSTLDTVADRVEGYDR